MKQATDLVLAYVVKIKKKKDLLDGNYGMAHKLNHKHPAWVGNYRAVYRDEKRMLDFVEGDREFVVFDYLCSEKLTLEEALQVCPEVLI